MARTKEKKRRDRAEEIREAADQLFCEKGYDGVSMRDIAERAQVNKGLLFYYYKSKADLFELVLARYYEAHREALASAFAAEGTLRERIHRMIEAYMSFMADNQRYARLVQQQVAELETHELIQRNLAPLFEWTISALSGVTDANGPLAARHFWITFSGLVINYFTYAPLIDKLWSGDPLAAEQIAERRAHVHWMVDAILEKLSPAE
ncbi:MAG: TetR/AcrR family transcriptional regulator [Myxococcales bacterium]|nr:TetR/AcrR family transcriptional regulator [Myxococcales bacterium]